MLWMSGERVFATAMAEIKLKAHNNIKPAPINLGETVPCHAVIRIPFMILPFHFLYIGRNKKITMYLWGEIIRWKYLFYPSPVLSLSKRTTSPTRGEVCRYLRISFPIVRGFAYD